MEQTNIHRRRKLLIHIRAIKGRAEAILVQRNTGVLMSRILIEIRTKLTHQIEF